MGMLRAPSPHASRTSGVISTTGLSIRSDPMTRTDRGDASWLS